ncbi:aromatic amino acid hydroxylase [Aestuariicella hydrocarbonica]|uniref:Aromatic amino acid hydroxylase n=1 Tax=Pseudomaricurvus hydrocarbonicus TaxID=1470433 RepID=A0A9E5MMW9_9GAMM|nr:aromatic amino acid hydroxylase [Aestuariicella hydrocarbonica]NHO67160.1 aromatic amino acid hydroxylase [Aestuariicella hydrocarbonica]
MQTQQEIINSLPSHLRPFAAVQDYRRYTPRDQAVWRFLLHQLRNNLSQSAESTYLEGLGKTGISLESIPRIEEMNDGLREIGWHAVVVDGFVPPAIFMEFQAQRVLVIAVDMRTFEHMLYTPAPDIVHESAGHAPFIIDVDYAEFLQRFGELGMHAIASRGDMEVYQAIRALSIIKENPRASAEQISAAEHKLTAAIAANDTPSEAALLSRLHWWTVEYGLVGTPDDYRIFGAGLLSSLGESVNCLDDEKVKKLPLTVDAISCAYDITCEQPQLFVTRNCRHLSQVLEEFGRQMCVNRGGAESVRQAIQAQTVNTAVTNAGLEISGQFSDVLTDAVGNVVYVNTTGPTQLAYQGKELPGQGIACHKEGFGCPVGRLQAMERCLSSYTVDELKQHGIAIDTEVKLDFLSGITVVGWLKKILRRDQKNLVFTFEGCTVRSLQGDILFDPAWGVFDMAVGAAITSVYGGSADQDAFPLYRVAEKSEAVYTPADDGHGGKLFDFYQKIRNFREASCQASKSILVNDAGKQKIAQWTQELLDAKFQEWLLYFELLEIAKMCECSEAVCQPLLDQLKKLQQEGDDNQRRLIQYGLDRLSP